MLHKLIMKHYGMEIKNISLLDSHFGTEVYCAETKTDKFVIKILPLYVKGVENEGYIADYIYIERALLLRNF